MIASLQLPVRRAHDSAAFSLVELLVVIAIVALLVGILLPALSKAQGSARTAACAANMHQLAVGFAVYALDNSGTCLPGRMPNLAGNVYPVGNGRQWRPRWFVTMGASAEFYAFSRPSPDPADDNRLLVDHKVFICPEAPERVNNRNFGYGYNHQFLGNSRRTSPAVPGRFFINFPVKADSLVLPGTVLFADALGTAAGKPAVTRTPYRVDGSSDLFAVGNHGWSLDPPRLRASGSDYCDDSNRADAHRSAPDARHGGESNVAFGDTRVESRSLSELGYAVNGDGSVAPRGGGAHNNLFSGSGRDDDPPAIN